MNHKFLSKSSWSIRGYGARPTKPVTTTKPNPPINSTLTPKESHRFGHQMIERQPSVRLESATNASSRESNIQSSAISEDDSKGLLRYKRMSYSVTDLRDLTHKKDVDWFEASQGFQQEIKDRRHEMYIADIEMDSFLQLGPTLRLSIFQFCPKFSPKLLLNSFL
jgi:hypothetical protein